ncbi:hypothetical protein VY88_19060 [Azospirillum thiophilum]|uniref:RNA polymerase subunit sigma-70 n=1 Tax=Azospirillum thiophilum TaxID=528244 RepID=A0AAC9EYD3_9PROT|nr:hypothetical protein [Azospirillum thiophilum]ALG74051.1 hypothetical protein AL072_23860 [Azospirillum thiophilum]KJR63608.1 hypothetical protein VY88_19060 [Azospirillum thiophilum]
MATLKEFEEALKAAGNTAALEILDSLRARDRSQRSIRPARRLTGRKMTPELAVEILHLHETTSMTQQEIAFQLGVNQGRVNEVIKRRKWLDADTSAPEAQARDKAKERAKDGVGFTPGRPAKKKKAGKPEPVAAAPEPAAPEPVAAEPVALEPVVPEPVMEPVMEPSSPSPPESLPELPMPMAAAEQPVKTPGKAKPAARKAAKAAKADEPPAQLPFKGLF